MCLHLPLSTFSVFFNKGKKMTSSELETLQNCYFVKRKKKCCCFHHRPFSTSKWWKWCKQGHGLVLKALAALHSVARATSVLPHTLEAGAFVTRFFRCRWVFKMLVDNHAFEAHSGFAPLCSLVFPALHKKVSAIQPAVTAMLCDLEVRVLFDPDCELMYTFPSPLTTLSLIDAQLWHLFRRIVCK